MGASRNARRNRLQCVLARHPWRDHSLRGYRLRATSWTLHASHWCKPLGHAVAYVIEAAMGFFGTHWLHLLVTLLLLLEIAGKMSGVRRPLDDDVLARK